MDGKWSDGIEQAIRVNHIRSCTMSCNVNRTMSLAVSSTMSRNVNHNSANRVR